MYSNGDMYSGEFKNGKMDGKGEYFFQDGTTFNGKIEEDHFSGEGLYKSKKQKFEYLGEFKMDKFNGEGTLKCSESIKNKKINKNKN